MTPKDITNKLDKFKNAILYKESLKINGYVDLLRNIFQDYIVIIVDWNISGKLGFKRTLDIEYPILEYDKDQFLKLGIDIYFSENIILNILVLMYKKRLCNIIRGLKI